VAGDDPCERAREHFDWVMGVGSDQGSLQGIINATKVQFTIMLEVRLEELN
jgi:hypothetical protein